ncbi:Thioredoxin family protein [Histomonas meleagridis]|uniref:Thioredoxin family protein n=1 Tax=Histomonas meleagridis TaxID=135588 RepID=UPI003559707E|nr:Thioredoxin family protein [Histomonas meleagridis]KAH0797461.1 Thioredoxin family protein [Histomonas meleagridis]
MISLLFSLVCSINDTNVVYLDSPGFRDNVIKKDELTTWVILFIGMNHESCIKAHKEFYKASEIIHGVVKFGIVNITKEPFLQRKLSINYVPCIKIYYSGGAEEYRGKQKASHIVSFISEKIPNFVRTFDRKWLEESIPSVVLFTEQIKVSVLWATLSIKFKDQYVRFGICNEFHIHREFSIAKLPTIVFFNSTNQIRYRGSFTEEELSDSISKFLNGTLEINDTFDDEGFYRMDEFAAQCHGRDFCVLHTGNDICNEYRQIRTLCKRQQMKFFYGEGNLPFKQMKENMYYIWNPRKKGFVIVEDIDELSAALDRVVDGGAKWIKAEELHNEEL